MERESKNIQTVERAFLALETISRIGPVNFTDLQKRLDINKASLSRITNTLESIGYIERNKQNGNLSLTLKSYEVGISAVQNQNQISLINSTLIDLRNETGLIAQFSIEDNNELICLQSMANNDSVYSTHTSVGERSPLYSTSAGKAILATYSNNEIGEKWNSFDVKPLTKNTIITVESLIDDLNKTRERGYALDIEENDYDLFCMGSAILNHNRTPIGAISVSGTSMTKEEEEHLSKIVLTYSKRLSTLLGYTA